MAEAKQPDVLSVVEDDGSQQEGCLATVFRYLMTFFCSLLMIIPFFWCAYIVVSRSAKGPGVFFFIPCVDDWEKVDLRIKTIDVPTQEMMTKDSVTVSVNAVVYFYVCDAVKSVIAVQNHNSATALLAQTTLRSVVGESELDGLLQERDAINEKMTSILDIATDPWGVKVTNVEIKDVVLPTNMQRAMGSQAEADRERRAKIISAEGELQAAENLLKAANMMSGNLNTMQLRYLQTLTQISVEKNSTIVFPLPLELLHLVGNR